MHKVVRGLCKANKKTGAVHLLKDQPRDVREKLKDAFQKISNEEKSGIPGFRRLKEMGRKYIRQLHAVHTKPGKRDLLQLAYIRSKEKQASSGKSNVKPRRTKTVHSTTEKREAVQPSNKR